MGKCSPWAYDAAVRPDVNAVTTSGDEANQVLHAYPARALQWAEATLRNRESPSRDVALAHLVRARLDLERGAVDLASSGLEQAWDAAQRSNDDDVMSFVMLRQSTLALTQGDLALAESLVDDAIKRSDRHLGMALAQKGLFLQRKGEFANAVDVFDAAEPLLSRNDAVSLVSLWLNRSAAHTYLNHFDHANHDLQRAQAAARANGLDVLLAKSTHNLGFVASRQGDLIAALEWFDQAAGLFAAANIESSAAASDRGATLAASGLFREAQRDLRFALAKLQSEGRSIEQPEVRLQIAELATALEDHDAALEFASAAMDEFVSQQRAGWVMVAEGELLRARFRSVPLALEHDQPTDELLRLAHRTRDLADQLQQAGWIPLSLTMRSASSHWFRQIGSVNDALRSLTETLQLDDFKTSHPFLADLARAETQVHRSRLAGSIDEARLAFREGLSVFDDHRTRTGSAELRARATGLASGLVSAGLFAEEVLGDPTGALVLLEAFRDSTLRLWPLSASMSTPEVDERAIVSNGRQAVSSSSERAEPSQVELATLDDALDGAMAVSFRVDHRRLESFVRIGNESYRFRSNSATETREAIDRVKALFIASCGSDMRAERSRRRFKAEREELGELLFAPIVEAFPGRQRVAVVCSDPLLSGVMWGAVNPHAWSTFALAPSLSSWHRASAASVSASPRRGKYWIAGPGLAGAEEEVAALRARFGGEVVMAAEATSERVLEILNSAESVHIAAHGLFRDDHPLLSGLVLSDRVLHGYDIDRLAQTPATVVLSACEGAKDDGSPGTHLGLATVLLARGTQRIVGALAPIPDRTTVEVMTVVYETVMAEGEEGSMLAGLAAAQTHESWEVNHAAQAFVVIGRDTSLTPAI